MLVKLKKTIPIRSQTKQKKTDKKLVESAISQSDQQKDLYFADLQSPSVQHNTVLEPQPHVS
jgi:hypothetical protein